MAKKETMEIAEIKGFEALAHLNSFNEALVEECQGMDFTFDRIKLPTGGGTAFEVPTIEDGESEMVKELVGVIVYNHPAYATQTSTPVAAIRLTAGPLTVLMV